MVSLLPLTLDGGRVRTRRRRHGRKTAKGRHGFSTPWREPRLLVIDILNAQGQPDRLRLPLYDVLIGDAEAVWALLIGYVRLLGAAYADVVEFIADGAEWIWKRVERLRMLAEIPPSTLVEVLDFYRSSGNELENQDWPSRVNRCTSHSTSCLTTR